MLQLLIVFLGSLLLISVARTHRTRLLAVRMPRPAPPPLQKYPSLTIIRPIRGLDIEAEKNLRNGLDLARGYPGPVETLFVFDEKDDPGVVLVERLLNEAAIEGQYDDAELLFCGPPPEGMTGKLNAMIASYSRARGEFVAFTDSDTRTDVDVLRELVETLVADPGIDCVFPSAVSTEPARTLGDAVCTLLLNGLQQPEAARVSQQTNGALPFILGQLMIFRREGIDAMGGLAGAQGQLTDDLYMGALIERGGLRNVLGRGSIRIIQYGLSPTEAMEQYVRWITFSRTGFQSWSFKLPIAMRVAAAWMGVIGAAWAALFGSPFGALLFAASAVAAGFSIGALHAAVGGAPLRGRQWFAPFVLCLLSPYCFLRAYRRRSMSWRGRQYAIGRSAQILASDLPLPERLLRPTVEE